MTLFSFGARRYKLRDKVVLITGGARGLGLALARELADRGARLAITARSEPALRRARKELAGRGAEVWAAPYDITRDDAPERLLAEVRGALGPLDVLINNAGVMQGGPFETATLSDYRLFMETHLFAPLKLTLAALPEMRARGAGRIVNISSIGGKVALPHALPYVASKFALTGLSEGLRAELAKDGVFVTTVCPGLIRLGTNYNAKFKGRSDEEHALFAIPLSLPLTSVSGRRAARRIVRACERGEASVILPLSARLAALGHDLFPGLAADIFGLINRLLPTAEGGTRRARRGRDIALRAPEWIKDLNARQAAEANELER